MLDRALQVTGMFTLPRHASPNLRRMIGHLTMENDLLKRVVAARRAYASDRQQWRQPLHEVATQYAAEHSRPCVALLSEARPLARTTYNRLSVGGEPTDNKRQSHQDGRHRLIIGSCHTSHALPAQIQPPMWKYVIPSVNSSKACTSRRAALCH
jgi:hypothetical protein